MRLSIRERGAKRVFSLVSRTAVKGLLLSFLVPCRAVASRDGFKEHFNLPQDPEPLLKKILEREEFREQPLRSLVEQLWDLLQDLALRALEWLLSHIPTWQPPTFPRDTLWLVFLALSLGFLLIMAVFGVVKLVPLILSWFARQDRRASEPEASDFILSSDAWKMAERMARQARYREAVIYLFRFAVLSLDEQGYLAFHDSKTNRELLAGMKAEPELRKIFAGMIPIFDGVRYGDNPCDQEDYGRFLVMCRSVTGN